MGTEYTDNWLFKDTLKCQILHRRLNLLLLHQADTLISYTQVLPSGGSSNF